MKRFFFLLLFLPSFAFSDDGYWYIYDSQGWDFSPPRVSKAPTVAEICTSYKSTRYNGAVGSDSGTSATCHIINNNTGGVSGYVHLRYREAVCEGSQVYEPESMTCIDKPDEPDQCESATGLVTQQFYWGHLGPDLQVVDSGKSPSSAVCESGCRYTNPSHDAVFSESNEPGAAVFSLVSYRGVGQECTGDEGANTGDGGGGSTNDGCSQFTNADGSIGWDCNPKPPPDPDTGDCPPGYGKQGNTCFKLPGDDDGSGGDDGTGGGDDSGTGDGGDGSSSGGDGSSGGGGDDSGSGDGSSGGSGSGGSGSGGSGSGDGDGGSGDGGDGSTGGGSTGGDSSGGSGSTGEGEGEENEGGGEGESVELCTDGNCSFSEEMGNPLGDDIPSFSDSYTKIFDGITSSPIGQSITNITFPSGGSCPTFSTSIPLMGSSIPLNFESHCSLWEQIAPVLGAAFMALWSLFAVRIVLSA